MKKQPLPGALKVAIGVSLVLHVGIVAGAVMGGRDSKASVQKPLSAMPVRLVKLGKKRDEKMLPRIEPAPVTPPALLPTPAPEPAPKIVVNKKKVAINSQTKAKSKIKKAPPKPTTMSAKERLAQLRNTTSSALDRLKRKPAIEQEGDPEGDTHGDTVDPAASLQGRLFLTKIRRCVADNYTTEGVDAARFLGLSAEVFVRVKGDGTLSDIRLDKSSGRTLFDIAVERAVKRCGKVAAPPVDFKNVVWEEGVRFKFSP